MTRSVEIPEAAVDYLGRLWWKQYDTESPYQHAQSVAKTREAIEGLLPYLAPVGDGGLREALEQHAEVWSTTGGPLGVSYATRVRDLLAAHPAAPAVPQPAVLPTCPNCWSETFECSACGSLVEPLESAVPQPVDRRELLKLFEREGVTTTRVMGELAYRQELADAVLALLAGEQEQVEP